jgi:hypothetical protein
MLFASGARPGELLRATFGQFKPITVRNGVDTLCFSVAGSEKCKIARNNDPLRAVFASNPDPL